MHAFWQETWYSWRLAAREIGYHVKLDTMSRASHYNIKLKAQSITPAGRWFLPKPNVGFDFICDGPVSKFSPVNVNSWRLVKPVRLDNTWRLMWNICVLEAYTRMDGSLILAVTCSSIKSTWKAGILATREDGLYPIIKMAG